MQLFRSIAATVVFVVVEMSMLINQETFSRHNCSICLTFFGSSKDDANIERWVMQRRTAHDSGLSSLSAIADGYLFTACPSIWPTFVFHSWLYWTTKKKGSSYHNTLFLNISRFSMGYCLMGSMHLKQNKMLLPNSFKII